MGYASIWLASPISRNLVGMALTGYALALVAEVASRLAGF